MQAIQILELALDPRLHRLAQKMAWVLKARLSVPMVAAVVSVAMLVWVIAGIRQRGVPLLLWQLVPLFVFAASVCIGGPNRLFNKREHEGRVVFQLSRKDAVTMLDVVGLSLAAAGVLLAIVLISWRVQRFRQPTT